jgi:hypothetical protein
LFAVFVPDLELHKISRFQQGCPRRHVIIMGTGDRHLFFFFFFVCLFLV